MSIKDITIVITSFKSDEIIRNCLNSINRQCQVILIENSNNLDFKKSIEREFRNVECILSGENFGYGKDNNMRLSGDYETADINTLSTGVADRGASIRIPRLTVQNKRGYFEDRRPASNLDPYLVTSKIAETTLL